MANIYADSIQAENPTAIWALDDQFQASLSALPGSIALSSLYGTPAYKYGTEDGYGYYLGTGTNISTLKASSNGIPMVYGSTNITNLYQNTYTIEENLQRNPSFEANVTGWTVNNATANALSTDQSYSGTYSLKVTQSTTGWNVRSNTISLSNTGVDYTFSAYVRSETNSENFTANLVFLNSGGMTIQSTSGTTIASSTTGWTRISVTATAPSETSFARLVVEKNASGTADRNHYVDAVLFERSSSPSDYFDGSSQDTESIDYVWSGTQNFSTSLANAINLPSLIVPGFGFLNEDGKNKRLTLEFWVRAMSSSFFPRRIVGPITGSDGLYINGNILSLKIGNNIASHHVSEWGRPMLIHLYYTGTNAGVLINGESVISLSFDYSKIEFPTKLNDSGEDQDWLGFYAYSDITPLQIDCIAIYPYQIPVDKSKLHFVKGQAVESPEIANSSYFDVPVVIDYQMSKYSSNYMYPGNGSWKNGAINNLITDNEVLSAPEYSLPQVVLENEYQTLDAWNEMQRSLSGQSDTTSLTSGEVMDNDVFFRVVPDNADSEFNYGGYLLFDKFNLIQNPTKAIYGVFEMGSLATSDELLFRVSNDSGEYFEAVANDDDIIYRFVSASGNVSSTTSAAITVNTKFVAGIDIDAFITAQAAYPQIAAFFNNPSSLKVFLGGPSSFNGGSSTDTSKPKLFSGKIYKFGFSDSYNLSKISSKFSSGIADNTYISTFNSHFASYTLIGINTMNTFSLDIAVAGTWNDYVALSQFAKNVTKDSGELFTFDFIQFNIDVPEYLGKLAVADSHIRTYVEFSEIAVSTVDSIQLVKTDVSVPSNRVVEPDADWLNKRYEVVNNTIIYKPTGGFSDFEDLGLITHIDFTIPGIYRNPAKLKMLHLSSQALGRSTVPTSIGTKFGKDIYSFGTTSDVRDYSAKNPYLIYKNSTPYLYLTKYSGIKLAGSTFDGTRGIEIPINKNAKRYYKVSVLSTSVMYDKEFSEDIELFRIKDKNDTVIVYADFTTGTTDTAEISAKYANGTSFTAIQYFVNGISEERTIKYGEWNSVGLVFTQLLDFSGISTGKIDITGPFVINNISDFQIDEQLETTNYNFNTWADILAIGTWSQVLSAESTWGGALLSSALADAPRLNASAIYNSYLGNSRISADNALDSLSVSQTDHSLYRGIRLDSFTSTPL